MICKIVSTDDEQVFDNLKSVSLPGVKGELEILPGHAETFVALSDGEITLKNESVSKVSVTKSVAHVKNDNIVITV